jgi:hypothetical protein
MTGTGTVPCTVTGTEAPVLKQALTHVLGHAGAHVLHYDMHGTCSGTIKTDFPEFGQLQW